MNKVNWVALGGAPLRNDDWQFEGDAVRIAIKGLGSVLGLNALLSGCVPSPSGGGYVFTSGYVMINGEVCFVPAITSPIPFDEDGNYFQLVESDVSPEGDVVMEDGSNANIYKQRIAVIGYDPDTLPPNSISWLAAYNNRFNAKALAAVVNETILPQKGLFWRRLNASLNIVSGAVSFDNKNGNFAVINTNNSTLQNILLSLSGGLQPCLLALKVVGTGYLKVEHGGIKCNGQRDHYFYDGDVILFINDGAALTDTTHMISEGESDVWHVVGAAGEPSYDVGVGAATYSPLRFKKEKKYVLIDGAVEIGGSFAEIVFQLPVGYKPNRHSYINLYKISGGEYAYGQVQTNGIVRILSPANMGNSFSFSTIRIPLD